MKKPVMRQRPYAVNARLVLWDRQLRIACNDAKEHVPPTRREVTILGAGMVHPVVLQNGGYDPSVYSGYAFGMGIERQAMNKYGVDDIRLFYSNDVRFLERI